MAILKQNGTSAKIIRANQSGKALKQNYNLGIGFNTYRASLKINKSVQTNDVSWWFGFTYRVGSTGAPGNFMLDSENRVVANRGFLGINTDSINYYNNKIVAIGNSSFYKTLKVDSNSSCHLISTLLIYDRRLSGIEQTYLRNNNLGNEPLNMMGIWAYYEFKQAVIKDNKILVLDKSDNKNHAIIEGLPAGTLQEQLDYANNNLFQPW